MSEIAKTIGQRVRNYRIDKITVKNDYFSNFIGIYRIPSESCSVSVSMKPSL